MRKMSLNAVLDRIAGDNPAPPRAAAVAASAGVATAVVVYRVRRHDSDD